MMHNILDKQPKTITTKSGFNKIEFKQIGGSWGITQIAFNLVFPNRRKIPVDHWGPDYLEALLKEHMTEIGTVLKNKMEELARRY